MRIAASVLVVGLASLGAIARADPAPADPAVPPPPAADPGVPAPPTVAEPTAPPSTATPAPLATPAPPAALTPPAPSRFPDAAPPTERRIPEWRLVLNNLLVLRYNPLGLEDQIRFGVQKRL